MDKEARLLAYLEPPEETSYDLNKCPCRNGNFTIHTTEWDICDNCGKCRDPPAIDMPDSSESYSPSYRRINHLVEYLNQVQAKERTIIPQTIITSIIDKYDKCTLTIEEVSNYLRENEKTYLEHSNLIYYMITGQEQLVIPFRVETKIKIYFKRAESAYFILINQRKLITSRKNFLGNNYVINRILGILEEPQLQAYFPLPKAEKTKYTYDNIWKAICKHNNWLFTASIN